MKWLAVPALIVATGTAVTTPVSSGSLSGGSASNVPQEIVGVANMARARQSWMLECQGCHRSDAKGSPQTTPTMAGYVAKFLHVPGGREYLIQVPGVATASLPDDRLAEVVNWSLAKFDPAHMPADFKPYTAAEVGRLRLKPLRADAPAVRAKMVARFAPDDQSQE